MMAITVLSVQVDAYTAKGRFAEAYVMDKNAITQDPIPM